MTVRELVVEEQVEHVLAVARALVSERHQPAVGARA